MQATHSDNPFILRALHLLLHTNDCVVIPGVGGFMTHAVSAQYDAQRQEWIPPTRDIVFNPRLAVRDGILEQELQRACGINFSKAAAIISRESDQLLAALNAGQNVELDRLGRLHKSEDGTVRFHPVARLSEQYAPLGLRRLAWPTGPQATRATEAPPVETEKQTPVIALPTWWRAAAAVALPIGLAATMLLQSPGSSQLRLLDWHPVASAFSPRLSGEDIRFQPVDSQTNYDLMAGESTVPGFSFHQDALHPDGAVVVEQLSADRLHTELKATAGIERGCFHHVVAGAFSKMRNARRLARSLKAAGRESSLHAGRRGLTLVSAGCFTDKGHALVYRDELLREHAISGAWVWTPHR